MLSGGQHREGRGSQIEDGVWRRRRGGGRGPAPWGTGGMIMDLRGGGGHENWACAGTSHDEIFGTRGGRWKTKIYGKVDMES